MYFTCEGKRNRNLRVSSASSSSSSGFPTGCTPQSLNAAPTGKIRYYLNYSIRFFPLLDNGFQGEKRVSCGAPWLIKRAVFYRDD